VVVVVFVASDVMWTASILRTVPDGWYCNAAVCAG
jgi:hypothetical protein